jgi:hypothetical protein
VEVERGRDDDAAVLDVDVDVNAVVAAVLEATVELVEAVEVASVVLVVDGATVDVD